MVKILLTLVLLSNVGLANQKIQGWCTKGGRVVTSGLNSTNNALVAYGSSSVSVFATGTSNLVSIFADNLGTPLANPFTANADSSWAFYVANSRVDVVCSGTVTVTFADILANDPSGVLGCSEIPALTGDVTTAGGTCTTVLPNVATAGTGLKTTINAKGQATAVATAASTDLSDTAVIARTNAPANFGANAVSGGPIAGTTGTFSGAVTSPSLTIAGEIAPDVTGRGLGDSGHRWDLFTRNVDISGNISGVITSSGPITGSNFVGGSFATPNVFGNTTIMQFLGTALQITGNETISNLLTVQGLASLSGGVCYTFENGKAKVIVSASCGYTTWALALAACPSTGCIMDGTAPDTPLAMGAFDTGSNTKPVTVNLGPYNFTATQITVRQGLRLRGAGNLSTNITSNGTNAQPLLVIPQGNNNAITAEISSMSMNALPGNTSQDGFFSDCSTLINAGFELSRIDNVIFNGFNGSSLHWKATQDGASGSIGCSQGLTLTNIMVTRPTGATGATQNDLRIEGGVGQFECWNCWFLGQSIDTGTNVFVGTTGTQAPYSIHFHGTTNQNGFAYLFDGCGQCTTDYDHFEQIKGAYNFLDTASPVHFTSTNAYINSNVATNAGNGYIVNIPVGAPSIDALVDKPFVGGQPDNCIKNASSSSTAKITNIRVIPGNTPANVCPSTGITGTITPAATVDLKSWDTVLANTSATAMATFKSTKMPGESIVICATGGSIQFSTAGNLGLGLNVSPLVVSSGDCVTFMRVDSGTPAFIISGSSPGGINALPAMNKYGGTTLAGVGLIPVTGYVSQTSKVASIGTTTIITTIAANTLYVVEGEVECDTTSAAATVTVTLNWTDVSNTAQTFTTGAAACTGLGANSRVGIAQFFQAKASTVISYSTTIVNTPTYDVRLAVRQMGTN